MISALLAAAYTFTATATGVEKGTPVEFLFTGKNSDRAYESMFEIDMPVLDFVNALQKEGLKRGKPLQVENCIVWPVGTKVTIEPAFTDFVSIDETDNFKASTFIYTGGTTNALGVPIAHMTMPASVVSFYTLGQSLIVPDGIHHQGDVYSRFKASKTLKKGDNYKFTISWDPNDRPKFIALTVKPGETVNILKRLKEESSKGPIEVELSFDPEMTVQEAALLSHALRSVDSPRVKFNGCNKGTLFYSAFLPLLKWSDRANRMVQPFELSVRSAEDKLVFIDEDWNVEGEDPKLTPVDITFEEAVKKDKTDTCFIYASKNCQLSRIYNAMRKLENSKVKNWYVFTVE